MRLHITELGRVTAADIELAPLTVLYGANNTGKSWVASAIYSAGRRLSIEGRLEGYNFPPPGELRAPAALTSAIAAAKTALDAKDGAEHKISLKQEELGELGPDGGVSATGGTLARWLGVPDQLPPAASLRWRMEPEDPRLFHTVDATLKRQGMKVTASAEVKGELFDPLPVSVSAARHEVGGLILGLSGWLRDGIFRRAACFPEERLGIVEGGAARVREGTQDRPWQSEGARDAARMLGELRGYGPEQRASLGGDPELARRLWEEVLGGRVEMDANGDLHFRQGVTRLPINAAGAGVRALALLSIYLELLASPGDLLVLDAPELGLGTGMREALARVLRTLPERGYLVVVTTRDAALAAALSRSRQSVSYGLEEQNDGSVRIGS